MKTIKTSELIGVTLDCAIATNKIEFDNLSSKLCGRMVSLDRDTRIQAAKDAANLLVELPKFLRNSPHCQDEIKAINTLIARVSAEFGGEVAAPEELLA